MLQLVEFYLILIIAAGAAVSGRAFGGF